MAGDNINIYVWPSEIWGYFRDHVDELEETNIVIAENKDNGSEVILYTDNTDDKPYLAVYENDLLVHDEEITGFDDAMLTCRKLYLKYMTDDAEVEADNVEEIDDEFDEYDEEIHQRELELSNALFDFICVASECTLSEEDEAPLLDEVLELIASYGYPIYRPVVNDADENHKVYIEYPYEESKTSYTR